MTQYVYQPYRASTLARELRAQLQVVPNDAALVEFVRERVEALALLLDRVAALELALEFYGNREHYDNQPPDGHWHGSAIKCDRGTRSRAALFNIPLDRAATLAWPPKPEVPPAS